jgi:hypothetical protein
MESTSTKAATDIASTILKSGLNYDGSMYNEN